MVLIPFKDAGKIAPHKDVYNLVDKTNLKPFWYHHISIWARITQGPRRNDRLQRSLLNLAGTGTRNLGPPSVLVLSNAATMAS